MKYKVNFISDAENDLLEIYKYVFLNDSEENAEDLFNKLHNKCLTLREIPERGHTLKELKSTAYKKYFEIYYKPYRIVYEIKGYIIYIHAVIDGRRNIQEILSRRLLR